MLYAVDGGLHEIVERVHADGSTTRWEVTTRYDGRDYPVKGDPARDTIAMTKADQKTLDIVNKKAGTVVSRMRIVVAADGRTRTNTVMDPSGSMAVLFFDRRWKLSDTFRDDCCRLTSTVFGTTQCRDSFDNDGRFNRFGERELKSFSQHLIRIIRVPVCSERNRRRRCG